MKGNSNSTNQHLEQDNLCYRSPGCNQANEGQQINGKDNTASGFNDQGKTVQQSAVSNPTPGKPGNGTTTSTPGPKPITTTLNVCKEVVDTTGNNVQPSEFGFTFTSSANPNPFTPFNECTAVTVAPEAHEFSERGPRGIEFTTTTTGECSVALEPPSTSPTFKGSISEGETQTCNIVNTITAKPATATLNGCKGVVNNAGSDFEPSGFQFSFVTPSNPVSFGGSSACTPVTVEPGQYAFVEQTGIQASYDVGVSGDCETSNAPLIAFRGTISPGETQTCTITNTIG